MRRECQERVSDPDMHHGTCVTHVSWCMPESLTSGFLRSRWWGKHSWHSRRMRNLQFYVSDKSPWDTARNEGIVLHFPGNTFICIYKTQLNYLTFECLTACQFIKKNKSQHYLQDSKLYMPKLGRHKIS